MFNILLKLVSGSNLPPEHRDLNKLKSISDIKKKIRIILRLFVVHPLKRRIAKFYLVILKNMFRIKVIAITGSAGKTTTKEMLTTILQQKGKAISSFKNIDPIYNIPTTILKCTPKTRYLILEMGVEFPGEMDFYLWLAQPDVGVVTNIYPTHLEFFGNVDGVFLEKSKLIKLLKKGSHAVLNINDSYLRKIKTHNPTTWFGKGGALESEIISSNTEGTIFYLKYGDEKVETKISLYGNQFVDDALAAAAAAVALDFNLRQVSNGLQSFVPAEHRMKVVRFKNNIRLFDDSYNNNPEAAKLAIKNFVSTEPKRKKILVFGDMLELGEQKINYHRDIGKYIAKLKVDVLICVGELAKYTAQSSSLKKIYISNNFDKIKRIIKKECHNDCDILIKGSRSINLDSLVDDLHF